MVLIRRLQRKDEKGRWYTDAYAIETPDKRIELRYPLSWEHLGAMYNAEFRKRGLTLVELDQVLSGRNLKWLPLEALQVGYEQALSMLDRECNIPRHALFITK